MKNCFVSDCQNLVFPEEFQSESTNRFDSIFSNATLHWCKKDPEGVMRSAKKCLKPGGRFVAEFGGFANLSGKYLKRIYLLKTKISSIIYQVFVQIFIISSNREDTTTHQN